MYKIGMIEDIEDSFKDYEKAFSKREINLIRLNNFDTIEELHQNILKEEIEVIILDYKLKPKYKYTGTEIISELEKLMPDFACFILTVYPEESIEEELVASNNIYDKKTATVLGKSEFENFVKDLKHAANVYKKRKENLIEEYKRKKADAISKKLNAKEKDQIKELYRLLSNYGVVEAIPMEMLEPEAEQAMRELIKKLDEVINKKR